MSIGNIVLAIWFLLYGIFAFVPVPQSNVILAALAIVVAILLLVGR